MGQPSSRDKSPATLQTVERSIRFLEFVAACERPPTVREVADGLGLNITTAHHLFNTLNSLGYLTRSGRLTMQIGSRVTLLNRAYRDSVNISRDLMDLVEELSESTGETASASMIVGNRVVIQALTEGRQPVRAAGLYVGLSGAEHLRASGKLVLALASEPVRASILAAALGELPDEPRAAVEDRLSGEAEEIRRQGWSIDDGGYQAEISGVSAPILDSESQIVGTINLSTPTSRFASRRELVIEATQRYAQRASEFWVRSR